MILAIERVRSQILMIAIISAIGFAVYLGVTYQVTSTNEHTIIRLNNIYYPALKTIEASKTVANRAHELLADAIILKEPIYIEDSVIEAQRLSKLLAQSAVLSPEISAQAQSINQLFENYYRKARTLSEQLIQDVSDLQQAQQQADVINDQFKQFSAELDALQQQLESDYRHRLQAIQNDLSQTIRIGVATGITTLLITLLISFFISRVVTRAIARSDQLKDAFLTAVSHELQTPLHGMGGALNTLEQIDLDAESRSQLNLADQAYQTMKKKIGEILIFMDLQSGETSLRDSDFCLWDELQPTIDHYRSECHRKLLEFTVNFDGVKTQYFHGDIQKILYLFDQLLSNAVKFCQRGSISLDILTRDQQLIVSVTDTGEGIDPDKVTEIFKAFHQLDGQFNRQQQGLGIGLAICQKLLELMEGKLNYQPNPFADSGSVFSFTLPVTKISPSQKVDVSQISIPAGLKTLVVEDNQVNQLIMDSILKKLNCEVTCVEDGYDALEEIRLKTFDVIYMDCQMPGLDGFETTKAIRETTGPNQHIPIVAVTANVLSADRKRCIEVGMNDFLAKPFSAEQIKETLIRYGRKP